MKALYLIVLLVALCLNTGLAQTKPKEKAPSQDEMEEMMKDARKMMGELSEEDKKMLDSMGVKLPGFDNSPKPTNKQLASAWEEENRTVPKRDAARIAAITKGVTDSRMETYIASIQKKVMQTIDAEIIKTGDQVYAYIKSVGTNSFETGKMATSLWIMGKPQMAVYVLGKLSSEDPSNTDNLSNYAAMLSMLGAQHLAIPILNNLNAKFPNNSTLLNNLGQAWLGLGELLKAEEYLNKALVLYSFHPQANIAKAAIEESKGNTEAAKAAIEKSIQHSYTREKEEKLESLGKKINPAHYLLPPRNKIDVLNLDGFRSPLFPMNTVDCITAEVEWQSFYEQIDEKINTLTLLRENAMDEAMKGHEKRMNDNLSYIKAAQANPGEGGQTLVVPLYAIRATKKLSQSMELIQRKLEAYTSKIIRKTEQNLLLDKNYKAEMERLHKENSDQTGSHRGNESYCPKYKTATDNYLKMVNDELQIMYLDALILKKELINESAHYAMYMLWPDEFQVAKLDYQIEWLNFLKKGFGAYMGTSGFPFVSITLKEYSCNDDYEAKPEMVKLQKFDDVNCEYHSELDWKVLKVKNDCSRMTTEVNLDFFKYVRKDDFERAEGDTYISSTVKVTAEVGKKSVPVGPVKVGASAGISVEVEMDRKGTKEVNIIGRVKAGVTTNIIEKDVPGKGKIEKNVSIGVEGRVGLISGEGSVSGTGILSGIKITEF